MNTIKELAVTAASNISDTALKNIVLDSLETDDWMQQVAAFHSLFELPNFIHEGVTKNVANVSTDRLKMRMGLVTEEAEELQEAVDARDEVEIADALGDLVYVVCGFALEIGLDLKAVLREIHASNMTKLNSDGQVLRREDGKVLKGDLFQRPNIVSVINAKTTDE